MSLARHVTPIEGFDYEAPPVLEGTFEETAGPVLQDAASEHDAAEVDESRPEWRQLTFNPLAPEDATEAARTQEPHIAAYKVPDWKRYIQVATGIVACWLASGVVFGFAALKPVLIAEGVFRELCDPVDSEHAFAQPLFEVPCDEQDLRLNLFFVVGSITTNVSSLFAGYVADRWGRRTCWTAACVFIASGCLLLGYSFSIPEFDGYTLGNFFLGLGGTFLFVPSFQLANAFPLHSGVVVALITGAFDASAAVFLFYRWAYDASGGRITLDRFFFGFLAVPALILAAEFAYMPPKGYHSLPELELKIERAQDHTRDVHLSDDDISDTETLTRVQSARTLARLAKLNRIEELVGDAEAREERVKEAEERVETSKVWGVLHGIPAHRQMMTPWFILMLLLTVLQMLRMNYFIATVRSQYRYMLGSDDAAEAINNFFDIALPVGGVLSTPFIGFMLNSMSVPTTFSVITLMIIAISVLNCVRTMVAGFATVLVFVVFRPLYYSAISDYATKVFGFATFGRIYGTLVCISGLANFGQSALDALTHGPLGGDSTPINIAMGAVGGALGVILTLFIVVRSKILTEGEIEKAVDVEETHMRLLSGSNTPRYGSIRNASTSSRA